MNRALFCGLVACLLACPARGEYRVAEVVLEKAGGPDSRSKGGCAIDGHLVLRGGFRDGKLRVPSVLSVQDTAGELSFTDNAVKGEFTYQAPRSSSVKGFTVEAAVKGGLIAGTWREKGGKASGKVSGRVRAEADLAKENAFSPGKDWPCWSGPFTSLAAAPCGLKLLDDFAKARPVWRGEELVPNGNGNALNYHNLALRDRTMGGGASAVVADGRVFVSYYQPAGNEYMKLVNKEHPRGVAGDQYAAELAKKAGLKLSPFMSEKFLVKADDVVVCMDAATGKTLWKAVFAGESMNQPSHKGGAVNNTPCVADGRVFAMGPGGTLRALDAKTGKLLWRRPGLSAEGVKPFSGARNMCTAPIYAGGALIMPDHGTTLRGIDPASGKDLWKLPGMSHPHQVPARWAHGGKEYVVTMTAPKRVGKEEAPAQAACLDPRTGKELWRVELGKKPTKGVSVFGDRMFAVAGGQCVAWKLGVAKAERAWAVPAAYACEHCPPTANGKYVALGGPKESRLLDAETGKELAAYKGPGPSNEGHVAFFEDRVLLSLDGSHGHSEMVVLGATPETFGRGQKWSQPHPQTTSYHNKFMTFPMVEGRIFFRGHDGVYCYDLRKK